MIGGKNLVFLALAAAVLSGCAVPRTAAAPPEPYETTRAAVAYVIDGDTLIVTTGHRRSRVRLLGLDAPEDTRRHDCFGGQSSAELRWLLPRGSPVLIARDRHRRDPYGRALAYVWRPDGTFVNRVLLRGGFATTMLLPPAGRHRGELLTAESRARRDHAGLWRACVNARAGPGRGEAR